MKTKLNSLCLAVCLIVLSVAAIGLTGCAGSRYERSTGEYIDDKGLNSRVNSALNGNPEYKFNDVQVTSFRGTVQLSGFVNTTDQKSQGGRDRQDGPGREGRREQHHGEGQDLVESSK
jgi:hypothetical protein